MDIVIDPLPGGSPELRGVLGVPEGAGPWPGVVVVHEAFGTDAVMRRQVERMTEAGYLTLMPNLYSEGGARRCLIPTFRAMMSGKGRAFADVEAARRHLAGRPDCTGRIGVIGFCMGGSFALLSAGRGFAAASVNYGRLPADKVLDAALEDACPIIASFGARDRTLRGAAPRLEATLTRLGVEHDVTEYPTAGHAFLNETETGPRWLRPVLRVSGVRPDPEAAAEAWQRIDAFFAEHLREPDLS